MPIDFKVIPGVLTNLNVGIATVNDGWVLLNNNTIRHNSTKTTRISKNYVNKFVVNQDYKINFTISNYVSCDFKIIVNNIVSVQNSNGVKEFLFKATSKDQEIIFESDGYLDISNITIYNVLPTFEILDFNDTDLFENKSFTVSYDMINNKWISYHQYLPTNYIKHNEDFLMFENYKVKKSNSDSVYLKAILEIVNNEYPITTKVLDSIVTNVETYNTSDEKLNDFFDKIVVYDEFQITGDIQLDNTNLTKKEKNWNFNKLLDISKGQSNVKLFSEDWNDIKNNYYIDKVINNNAIDITKPWFKRARFRDKYFIIRFYYDNLDNNKILINFVNTNYRISQR